MDTVDIDVRVIVASNRNLKEEVKAGNFREDLFFRINVFPIELPLLADRGQDVLELAEHFLAAQGYPHPTLAASVRELFLRYDWPGNIRELRNVLERAIILAAGEPLTPEEFALDTDDAPLAAPDGGGSLESAEKKMILSALEKAGGNKTEAANLLRITRRRLYSRMKIHGIKP